MKHLFPEFRKKEGELIASWGDARLIKTLDGRYELVGGSKDDLTSAHEWISITTIPQFLKEKCWVNV
jgi:hypothetical protein